MKKKKKQKLKEKLKQTLQHMHCNNLGPLSVGIQLDIVASEEENAIYIKMSNFEEFEDVVDYSEYLAEYLPLLLYQSEVVH